MRTFARRNIRITLRATRVLSNINVFLMTSRLKWNVKLCRSLNFKLPRRRANIRQKLLVFYNSPKQYSIFNIQYSISNIQKSDDDNHQESMTWKRIARGLAQLPSIEWISWAPHCKNNQNICLIFFIIRMITSEFWAVYGDGQKSP